MPYLDVIIQGTLLGGLYCLFASGLAVAFGVMRLVNLAHGDMIVLSAFAGLGIVTTLPINPLAAIFLLLPIMCGFGFFFAVCIVQSLD